jgi:hypothetical protein
MTTHRTRDKHACWLETCEYQKPNSEDVVHGAVTAREKLVFLAVVVAQLLDTLTFVPAVARVGIDAEHNILVRHLYVTMGPAGPLLLKVAAIGIVIAALTWIHRRYPRRLVPVALVVVAAGLFGAWSNVAFGLI